MNVRPSFLSFLESSTRWWLVVPAYSLLLSLGLDYWFLATLVMPWIAIKVYSWKNAASDIQLVDTAADKIAKPLVWVKFAVLAVVLLVPAYVVSKWGPDHKAFFKDIPYQAARESGLSPEEALRMVPVIVQGTPLPTGVFLTLTGWVWFLLLATLYVYRAYQWLMRLESQRFITLPPRIDGPQIAQSKLEEPARQELELKETPASASCEVASPRKSVGKIIKWGAISAFVMFAAVGFGVFKYQQLIEQTQSYLRDQSSPKVMNGYEVLAAVGLRDMPGFSGPLGKYDAARLAKELMSEEDRIYSAIDSNPMRVFLDSKVKQCTNQVHLKRRQELKTLIEFTKTMFIENRFMDRAWDSISANSQSNFECITTFNAIYGSSTSDKNATRSETSDTTPAPVPSALAISQLNTQTGKIESRLEDKYEALHAEKAYAEWGEDDMINAVNLLAHPETEEDRKWLKKSEKLTLSQECSTGSCLIHQQEFSAAKKMREGKAKSAREALELDTKSASTPVPSLPPAEPQHLPNTARMSQAVDLMLGAARADNLSREIGEQAVLRNLPRPERGDRKNAREKNSAGLSALNSGNYKVAADFFAEGVKADRSDVELLNNLAYALLMDGQFEAAKAKLIDVLGVEVGRSGAWANLGDVFAKMGNQRDAIAAYKLTYYFSRAPEKTLEFFEKRSELDVDEKVRYSSAKAIPTFSGIKPLNERP